MGDDAMDKLKAFCRENMIRIEVFAGMGYGCMEIDYVDSVERAIVVIESEED